MKTPLLALAALAAALVPCLSPTAAHQGAAADPARSTRASPVAAVAPVTVILLRHAETATSTKADRDPPLSEDGLARAAALARLLARSGAAHLFATEYARTQATLAPLAKELGIAVTVIPAGDPTAQVAALRALAPGSVAVVAGHSNTVPALAAALGVELADLVDQAPAGKSLDHDSYDRVFVVRLPVCEGEATGALELSLAP